MYESRRAEGIRADEKADDRAFTIEQTQGQRDFAVSQQ
jgi:hypothetical protein